MSRLFSTSISPPFRDCCEEAGPTPGAKDRQPRLRLLLPRGGPSSAWGAAAPERLGRGQRLPVQNVRLGHAKGIIVRMLGYFERFETKTTLGLQSEPSRHDQGACSEQYGEEAEQEGKSTEELPRMVFPNVPHHSFYPHRRGRTVYKLLIEFQCPYYCSKVGLYPE